MNTVHLITLVFLTNFILGMVTAPIATDAYTEFNMDALTSVEFNKSNEMGMLINDDLNTGKDSLWIEPGSSTSDNYLDKITNWNNVGDAFFGVIGGTVIPLPTIMIIYDNIDQSNGIEVVFGIMIILSITLMNIALWMRIYDKVMNRRAD